MEKRLLILIMSLVRKISRVLAIVMVLRSKDRCVLFNGTSLAGG